MLNHELALRITFRLVAIKPPVDSLDAWHGGHPEFRDETTSEDVVVLPRFARSCKGVRNLQSREENYPLANAHAPRLSIGASKIDLIQCENVVYWMRVLTMSPMVGSSVAQLSGNAPIHVTSSLYILCCSPILLLVWTTWPVRHFRCCQLFHDLRQNFLIYDPCRQWIFLSLIDRPLADLLIVLVVSAEQHYGRVLAKSLDVDHCLFSDEVYKLFVSGIDTTSKLEVLPDRQTELVTDVVKFVCILPGSDICSLKFVAASHLAHILHHPSI